VRPALPLDPRAPDASVIGRAAGVLRGGGLVAFPTETVYGLGARAWDARAIARIFEAKGRPATHPLIAHVVDAAQARELAAAWPERADLLARAFWPGPLTLVVERNGRVPAALSGGGPSVAVRAPAHAIAQALIRALGDPVAAPSANVYQGVSPTTAAHVLKQLGDRVDMVLDGGACAQGIESTVVDVRGGAARVLRPGGVGLPQLRSVLPDVQAPPTAERTVSDDAERASPGMDVRHYAPRASLVLAPEGEGVCALAAKLAGRGARVGLIARGRPPAGLVDGVLARTLPDDPEGYARLLYATLHDLDDAAVDAIVVEDVPRAGDESDAWLAVADRLTRAAKQ
jgi:L-threonylcarbamoyladenylate synthase